MNNGQMSRRQATKRVKKGKKRGKSTAPAVRPRTKRPNGSRLKVRSHYDHPGLTPPSLGTQHAAPYTDSYVLTHVISAAEAAAGVNGHIFLLNPKRCHASIGDSADFGTLLPTLAGMTHSTTAATSYRTMTMEAAHLIVRNTSPLLTSRGTVVVAYQPDVALEHDKSDAEANTLLIKDSPASESEIRRMTGASAVLSREAHNHCFNAQRSEAAVTIPFNLNNDLLNDVDANTGFATERHSTYYPGAFFVLLKGFAANDTIEFELTFHAKATIDPDMKGIIPTSLLTPNVNHPRRTVAVPHISPVNNGIGAIADTVGNVVRGIEGAIASGSNFVQRMLGAQ